MKKKPLLYCRKGHKKFINNRGRIYCLLCHRLRQQKWNKINNPRYVQNFGRAYIKRLASSFYKIPKEEVQEIQINETITRIKLKREKWRNKQ